MILLHCIVQPEFSGGENEVTDGLLVCERLKQMNTDHYKRLSTIPVRWIDRGHDNDHYFHSINVAPVIWYVLIPSNELKLKFRIFPIIIE